MGGRDILGLIEQVILLGSNGNEHKLIARIDSGAITSSIDSNLAEKLELGPTIKSKVVKSASGVEKRAIVEAQVRINGLIMKNEFTIADRSHMTYPMLIGQNILKQGKFLIDPLKEAQE